jgi:hypothetical protein
LDSFSLDYVTRQKVGGTDLSHFYVQQLAVLAPAAYSDDHNTFIRDRALELICTDNQLRDALSVGARGDVSFRWNDDRRFLLRSELDALFFHLYGIARDDVDYIMDTFPIVRRKDEQQFGEYRTKRVILEIYDAMADAELTGVAYQTRLDPPPADPRVAHTLPVAVQTQPALISQPMLVPSLDLVASGAWATPPGIQPGNFVLLAVTEVLHRFGAPVDPHRVWMAVHFVRNPAMALAFLDKARMKDWVRVIGPGAQPAQKNVVDISRFRRGATDQLWGDAIIYLKSIGALVESSGLWSVTSVAPSLADEEWLAGRADMAVRFGACQAL